MQRGGVGHAAHRGEAGLKQTASRENAKLGAGRVFSEDRKHRSALVAIDQNPAVLIENEATYAERRLADTGEDFLPAECGEIPGANGGLGTNDVVRGGIHGMGPFYLLVVFIIVSTDYPMPVLCQFLEGAL